MRIDMIGGQFVGSYTIVGDGNEYKRISDIKTKRDKGVLEVLPLTYPNIALGFKQCPTQQDILIRNATVWTSEDAAYKSDDGIYLNWPSSVRRVRCSKINYIVCSKNLRY